MLILLLVLSGVDCPAVDVVVDDAGGRHARNGRRAHKAPAGAGADLVRRTRVGGAAGEGLAEGGLAVDGSRTGRMELTD